MILSIVVTGEINRVGVVRPLTPDIYLPVLRTLDNEGITPHVTITKMCTEALKFYLLSIIILLIFMTVIIIPMLLKGDVRYVYFK